MPVIIGVGVPTGQESRGSIPGFGGRVDNQQLLDASLTPRYSRKGLSTINLDLGSALTVANSSYEKKINGTFLWYASAIDSSNTVLYDRPVYIKFDRNSADQITFLPGMSISGIPFDKLYITHSAFTAGDIGQLVISTDSPSDRLENE